MLGEKRGSEHTQPDIWNLETRGLSVHEMHTNADFFILAGSETTGRLGVSFAPFLKFPLFF